ncbi:hypothetical protein ILYODFUR_033511 [Ilyodon furcidens]|uniref:Uncharacterized protein n=1 Tax=Ilyodon furcidens TaxID=33524 RepID=A0ABV0VBP2_9TELE
MNLPQPKDLPVSTGPDRRFNSSRYVPCLSTLQCLTPTGETCSRHTPTCQSLRDFLTPPQPQHNDQKATESCSCQKTPSE